MDSRKAGYAYLISLPPAKLHKKLMSYFLCQKEAKHNSTNSKYQTDYDIIHKNHKFLWEDEDEPTTWEENLAKRYYDKLYKEYCICNLSSYQSGKVAMRWRTEQELISGKGQFICADKNCSQCNSLTSWEVNFGYVEHGKKKNALVKLRLCADCSSKLNYKSKKGTLAKVKRKSALKSHDTVKKFKKEEDNREQNIDVSHQSKQNEDEERMIWKNLNQSSTEEKSRDEDFEEFLNHILL